MAKEFNADDLKYTITINNVVTLKDPTTKTPKESVPVNNSNGNVPSTKEQANKKKKSSSLTDALSAQLILGSANKLMNSIQNDKIQSFTSAIGMVTKYTALGVRALSGDVTAVVGLVVDVAAEAITSIQQTAMQVAAEQNSVDDARVAAGVMSLEGVTVNKNWWSGRYEYER